MDAQTIDRGDAIKLLEEQVKLYSNGVSELLRPFDAASAARGWLSVIRGIEEFINIPLEDP